MKKRFPFFRQYDTRDCGPTCLKMIMSFYGRNVPLEILKNLCHINREGVSLLGIEEAAKSLGFVTTTGLLTPDEFFTNHYLPCILHWGDDHFVVIHKITNKYAYVADPEKGRLKFKKNEFMKNWIMNYDPIINCKGAALFLEESDNLLDFDRGFNVKEKELTLRKLYVSLLEFKGLLILLAFGILLGMVIQIIFPYLTKAIIDIGVEQKSIYYITVILAGQLIMFLGQISIDFIRRWVLLRISTRVNLKILTNFLQKLFKLPISFFDTKHVGDMLQRMNDHNRIETFLTASTTSSIFSIITLIVFGAILAIYNLLIFLAFIVGSILYTLWVVIFLRKRKTLDIIRFELLSANHNKVIELMGGMQDIKLNLIPNKKRWEWERIQAKLFNLNSRILALNQVQEIGATSINQLKNIVIIFLSAKAVIDGNLTLGEMLATQYIVGQLNSPIEQLITFIQSAQDAKLSVDRLNEVHLIKEEEQEDIPSNPKSYKGSLIIKNVSFEYPGTKHIKVLDNISEEIEEGKVTAIVGASGSGKTTLIKLLLMIYDLSEGEIFVGCTSQTKMNHSVWRANCGTVLQDGYIFSDSIANNIALDEAPINWKRLIEAASMANISDYIQSLPSQYNTIIGNEGNGLSQGQKQRILIARSIYKNPRYLFLDEATNALDATNESQIMVNLRGYFRDKTVVIVAHRLSTVKHADKIIVINKGKIVESGNHNSLIKLKRFYYNLVKDQLDLEN